MRRARFIERQTSVSAALASVFLDAPSIELPQAAHNQRAVRSGCQLRAVLLREAQRRLRTASACGCTVHGL